MSATFPALLHTPGESLSPECGGSLAASLASGVDKGPGRGGEGDASAAPSPLPGLSVLSQLESEKSSDFTGVEVTLALDPKGSQRSQLAKRAECLFLNLNSMWKRRGLEGAGFVTVTSTVRDRREFQRRWNIFNTNFLRKIPDFEAVTAIERNGRKMLHAHVGVALPWDIRTGFDFEALRIAEDLGRPRPGEVGFEAARARRRAFEVESGWYGASQELRAFWRDLRDAAVAYRLGRTECFPVKSNAEGCARYVGGYVGKDFAMRDPEDKGLHQVRYALKRVPVVVDGETKMGSLRVAHVGISWTVRGRAWRRGCAYLAFVLQEKADLASKLGPRWAFHYAGLIGLMGKYPGAVEGMLGELPAGAGICERMAFLTKLLVWLTDIDRGSPR